MNTTAFASILRRPRRAATALSLLLAATAAACAEERAPIDRVQPNALDKGFFVGALADSSDDPEFYFRTTVVDAPTGAADGLFTSADSQPVTRIKWQITEKLLVARLTYELVQDTDHKGARRTNDGQPVAAYAIEKHFDVRYDYNSSTGEELNVLVENDTDRPWSERQFMRVDWSKNLITDAYELDTLSQIGIWYGILWSPVAFYVSDPKDPNAPVFDTERGYFDVTNKALASPQLIHDPDWGDFPACYLVGEFPIANCNPSEITLRQSFKRVVDTDYEPIDYDGVRMDMFGVFSSDRFGYDRRYGVVDDKWHRFAARWNIWDRSHVDPIVACNTSVQLGQDPHADADGDGTEDQCASVGRGSRCDEVRGECTIPYRDRKVKTIVWYTNPGFPEDLWAGTVQALDGWSESIRVAVVAARLAECRRTKEASCEATLGWPTPWTDDYVPPYGSESAAQVPKVFVLCHNPVDSAKGDDNALCGEDGLSPRLGDLRYNFINVFDGPQINSPWGIMVDAEDPLTGEKIAGSVNQWGAVLDSAASQLVDILGLLNGEIAPDQYLAGKTVSDWVKANQPGRAAHGAVMSAAEVASRKGAFDAKKMAGLTARLPKRVPGVPSRLYEHLRAQALADEHPGSGNAALTARMAKLRGTEVEAKMISPELLQSAGFDPTGPVSSAQIAAASPFGRMNPAFRRKLERGGLLERARRHSCRIDDLAPDNLIGLAQEVKAKFPAPDPNDYAAVQAHQKAIWTWARQQYSIGVLAHEMGHSMGLRHNFAGSFDALNYHPQYWQLRTNDGQLTNDCPEGTTDGSTCVGPRWRDPYTEQELSANIGRYAMTSVMDYPGDQNHDMMLQGKYDRAAMRFIYGNVADVWAGDGLTVNGFGAGTETAKKLTAFATSPGLFGVFELPTSTFVTDSHLHYSQYQKTFSLIRDCTASNAADAVNGTKCKEAPMDVVDYRDLVDYVSDPAYAQFDWAHTKRAIDPAGRVRRGYMFSSDEFADTGNVPSFRYDAGADAYEQIKFLEQAYENRYILDAFRRNRVRFNSWDTVARVQGHYLDHIQAISKTFAFAAVLYGDPAKPSEEILTDGWFGPLELGATVAFDLFARMMTRPEPGAYCDPTDSNCPNYNPWGVDDLIYGADPYATPDASYPFQIGLGPGRYVHNDYDYSKGYWWSDYQTQVGAYYEKVWATYYLAEAYDNFVSNSKQDFTDGRYKNLNFASIFPEQVRRLYGGLLAGDPGAYAPWAVPVDDGTARPTTAPLYPTWHAADASAFARPAGAVVLDPNWSWNEQLFAMVFGAIFFPTDWSNAWLHDARITLLAADQVAWPANETIAFYNPATGLTYRAHSTGTEALFGKEHQKAIGARMLEWANWMVYIAYKVELDADGLPVLDAEGKPTLVLDANGHPQLDPETDGSGAVLQAFVDNIDLFRQLTATYERDDLLGGL